MKKATADHPIDALEEQAPIPPVLKENSDQAFFVRFAIVVLLLHGVAGCFALIAWFVGARPPDPELHGQIDERTRPVAEVFTSIEAAQANVQSDSAPAAAIDVSGQQAVDQYCAACHVPGLLGAPKDGDAAAWQQRERAAGGVDGLLASAIRGKGQMPPRGGVAGLSDRSLREAIDILRQ